MITIKTCPNCESSQISEYRIVPGGTLTVEMTPGVNVNAAIITRYCLCQDCRLIFQNPRLSDKKLDIYYSSGYYRKTISQPPEGMDKGEENRANIDAGIIKQYVGDVISHLDIGCGRGFLLEKVGAKIRVGTESDINYVTAKNVKVFSDLDLVVPKKFGLVTAIHLLEHVPRPLDFLRKMAQFVNPKGHLVVEVPSWKTRGGPFGFAHLSYFEPDVLKIMCKKVGLRIIVVEFTPHLVLVCDLVR